MAVIIPNVINWSVTPQNGQEDYFTKMNIWLSESTSVIASLNTAITKMNESNTEINNLATQTENNAIVATSLANYQGTWSESVTYSKGQSVDNGSGLYYISKQNSNLNHVVTDTNYWLPNPINNKLDKITTNITVTVGSGGQFSTINQALEYLTKIYPTYKSSGVTATIQLLAGFVMAEQVLVRGLNLGWITITGEDAETNITHTSLTINFTLADYGFSSYPAFGVSKGGVLPRINQLFNMNLGVSGTSSDKHGVLTVGAGSSADIMSGKGVKNAGSCGIYAISGSTINANSAIASGAGSVGIRANKTSTINASNANASGAGIYGIDAYEGSTINARNAIIQNQSSTQPRITVAFGSTINALGINTTGGTSPVLNQIANTLTANGIIYQ